MSNISIDMHSYLNFGKHSFTHQPMNSCLHACHLSSNHYSSNQGQSSGGVYPKCVSKAVTNFGNEWKTTYRISYDKIKDKIRFFNKQTK